MSIFQTTNHNGVSFTRAPFVGRNPHNRGWVINAYSNDADLYNGRYIFAVGFADQVNGGHIAFRLKRDAVAAMREAIALGILK
jgi:hypothetical protein